MISNLTPKLRMFHRPLTSAWQIMPGQIEPLRHAIRPSQMPMRKRGRNGVRRHMKQAKNHGGDERATQGSPPRQQPPLHVAAKEHFFVEPGREGDEEDEGDEPGERHVLVELFDAGIGLDDVGQGIGR